jgi:hypothetical protein
MKNLVEGVIYQIGETQTFGTNGFRKRELILEQEFEKFINYIPIEFVNDNCDALNNLKTGAKIEVAYNLNGRKWQKDQQSEVRFFVNVRGYDYRILDESGVTSNEEVNEAPQQSQPQKGSYTDAEIPF